jgi:mRNA (guanine-N7-)-methyltransferase
MVLVSIVLGVLMVPAQGRPQLEDAPCTAPRHNINRPEYDPEDPFAGEDEYDPEYPFAGEDNRVAVAEDPFAGEDNRVAVAELYNNATATDENARRNGSMISMKRFHNEIKDFLLGRFAYNRDALLDLCCGRGGDIHKWIKNKVKFVKALDLSDVSLADAKTRYAEVARTKKIKTKVEFVHTSSLGTSKWKDDKEYDVITCMFAMHYISDREDTMRTFLHNVAINLKPGGIFMGTIASGTRVMQMLGVEERLQTGVLKLYKMWSKDQEEEVAITTSRPFGMRYLCSITDTVTSGNSPEYLTFIKPVEDILAEYGIFPVTHYGCQELDHCFDIEDDDRTLKHFCPPANFSKEIREVSSMFGAFVFRKKKP